MLSLDFIQGLGVELRSKWNDSGSQRHLDMLTFNPNLQKNGKPPRNSMWHVWYIIKDIKNALSSYTDKDFPFLHQLCIFCLSGNSWCWGSACTCTKEGWSLKRSPCPGTVACDLHFFFTLSNFHLLFSLAGIDYKKSLISSRDKRRQNKRALVRLILLNT